jgi:hypothetical protein
MFPVSLISLCLLPAPVVALSVALADEPATAEALLDRLEVDAASLEDFTTKFQYRKYDDLMMETTITIGTLTFDNRSSDEGGRRFTVEFEREGVGAEFRDRHQEWVFDGTWLLERDTDLKQAKRRQVVGPGEAFDPFSLDEGLFPLPVGQAKSEVLARFEAALVDLPPIDQADEQAAFLSKTLKPDEVFGLLLTPKPGTPAAEEFATVTIYYDRATLLPAGVDAVKTNRNRDIVLLGARQRNAGVDDSRFDTSLPTDPSWRVTQEGREGG